MALGRSDAIQRPQDARVQLCLVVILGDDRTCCRRGRIEPGEECVTELFGCVFGHKRVLLDQRLRRDVLVGVRCLWLRNHSKYRRYWARARTDACA